MKNLIKNIQEYSQTLDKGDSEYLGFSPEINPDKLFKLLKKGWWNIFFFGTSYNSSFGLRIEPKNDYSMWPIMSSYDAKNATTIAPDIASFFYLNLLSGLTDPDVFEEFTEIFDDIKQVSLPFLELSKGETFLSFFKDYFTNKNNFPETEEKVNEIYTTIWFHFDKTYGHTFLRSIIDKFANDSEAFVDEVEIEKLGIWKSRILYILTKRACKLNLDLSKHLTIKKYFWELIKQIHVYDSEDMYSKQTSNTSTQPNFELLNPIMTLGAQIDNDPDFFKNEPLFPAFIKMNENLNSYSGLEHIEAAAIYDSKHNDPIMAWNCLVNAAYWSGLNSGETLLPAWEAAIYLAEKHNWQDAWFALKTQYDWYIEYKKKNNID